MMADTKLIAVLLLPLLFCAGCTGSGKERDLQSTLESLWNKYKAHSLIFKPDENPVAQGKETSTDKVQTEEIIGPFGLKKGISVEDLKKNMALRKQTKARMSMVVYRQNHSVNWFSMYILLRKITGCAPLLARRMAWKSTCLPIK